MSKIDGGLRALFHQHLPHLDWVAIESGLTGLGIPDSNYVEGWIEFKRATVAGMIQFQPGQIAWLGRRVRAGGRAWVGVRYAWAASDDLYLVHGGWADDLAKKGVLKLSLSTRALFRGGPVGWNWPLIGDLLVR